ncbi:hypothetical protein XCR_1364 [Xanthomonas campestris pv. raphani 756C]|nr:hypothetical protein XCR_1364 [Xanthomonas campestris pv. raphani 756C]
MGSDVDVFYFIFSLSPVEKFFSAGFLPHIFLKCIFCFYF